MPLVSADNWTWATPDARVDAIRLPDSRWRITTRSFRGWFVPRDCCDTSFPPELVERLLRTTCPEWICDKIARFEDPAYVHKAIRDQIFAYVSPETFVGARMLDFGCGTGASTTILGRLLPATEVIGVELDEANVAEAQAIADWLGLPNVRFLQSPDAASLPPDIGTFDFVMMSAVFEHLLPLERRELMPVLWRHLRPGGVVFVNQTPHRWMPYEHHSSGLWGINYLPDYAAWWLAFHYGFRTRGRSWEEMLRGGIRGGTERSIRSALTRGRLEDADIQQPRQNGLRDRSDLWLRNTAPRHRSVKRLIAAAFRWSDRLWGVVPSLNVEVAIRKRP